MHENYKLYFRAKVNICKIAIIANVKNFLDEVEIVEI